jgi:hypothetical protein
MRKNRPFLIFGIKLLASVSLTLFIILLSYLGAFAQELDYIDTPHNILWSAYAGSPGYDRAESNATDFNGNSYVAGYVSSQITSTPATFNNAYCGGAYDGYLSKRNIDGEIVWSVLIGGDGSDFATAVAIAPSGDIIVAGYSSTTNAFLLNNEQSQYNGGLNDAFIAAYSPEGTALWSRYIGGAGEDYMNDICVTADGAILLCGRTTSHVVPYPSSLQPGYGGGIADGFIAQLDEFGMLDWYSFIGGAGDDEVRDVTSDFLGNIFFCGNGNSISTISAASGSSPAGGPADAFIACLDEDANMSWATYAGGTGYDVFTALTCNGSSNVIASGSSDSGPISGFTSQNATAGNQEAIMACYSLSGILLWGRFFGGSGTEMVEDVHLDLFGNLYLAGSTSSMDMTTIEAFQPVNTGGIDNFITKWNLEGQLKWSSYYGGASDDFPTHLSSDRWGKISLTGNTFSDNIPSGQVPYMGSSDMLITRISDCDNPDMIIHALDDTMFCDGGHVVLVGCGANHMNWITGDTTITTSINEEMYAHVIGHNVEGCYGMSNRIFIDVLENPQVEAVALGDTIFCGEGTVWLHAFGAETYVWSDESTDSTLLATDDDIYIVTGTGANGCKDKSDPISLHFDILPEVVMASTEDTVCISDEPFQLIALPLGGYFVGDGITDGYFDPLAAGGGIHQISYNYVSQYGCLGTSDPVQITVFYMPTVILNAEDTLCLFDDGIQLGGSPGGGTFTGDGLDGSMFYPSASGTGPQNIYYSYVDANGCTNVAHTVIVVDACLGNEEFIDEPSISVYPNPATDAFTIDYPGERNYTCQLISYSGQLVRSFNGSFKTTVDCSDLANGLYLAKVMTSSDVKTFTVDVR